jgi:hypothetical protein
MIVNRFGYVMVKHSGGRNLSKGCKFMGYRDFWIGRSLIPFHNLHLPQEYWGKRIRLKVEIDESNEGDSKGKV